MIDIELVKLFLNEGLPGYGGEAGEGLEGLQGLEGLTLEMVLKAMAQSGMTGAGSPSRGPGYAPLRFSHQTKPAGTKFKPEILPAAQVHDRKKVREVTISKGDAEVTEGEDSTPGVLQRAAAGGGSANSQLVLPKHRGTIQRFFERTPSTANEKK
jgi:hypothetical protein